MEIPENILQKLKCEECGGYLSSSPVMLKNNGNNICGHCAPSFENDDEKLIRNTVYEDVATLILFPCAYKEDGCNEKLPIGKMHDHEMGCRYQKHCCPMFPINDCAWMGKLNQLKHHYEQNHEDLMITQHPYEFVVDISRNYENYYLVVVFNLLFLLQIKCNKAAAKLWYCVRFIGDPKFAKNFTFELNIGCSDSKIFKRKPVESFETVLLSQSKVLEIDINILIHVISSYFAEHINGLMNIRINNENCLRCFKSNLDQLAFLDKDGYICKYCEELFSCRYANLGCSYKNKLINLAKHEHLFCHYGTKFCLSNHKCNVKEINNWEHLLKHKIVRVSDESIEHNLEASIVYGNPLLVIDDVKFIRRMSYSDSVLHYKILCGLPKDETLNYKCIIRWINRLTNYEIKKELLLNLDSVDYDWSIDIHDSENKILYDIYNGGVTIKAYSIQTSIKKIV